MIEKEGKQEPIDKSGNRKETDIAMVPTYFAVPVHLPAALLHRLAVVDIPRFFATPR